MQLFKRMMLSLFPDEMVNNPINPASVFVGFISAKQYFSVITRKIVENYKLNLFDISLDPFEVKIGFGDAPTIKVKDVDFYYGYAAAANLNGFRSFAPGQAAHAVSLVTSIALVDLSNKYEDFYLVQFLYAVYLLTFVFQSKLKQFPQVSDNDDFAWLVELIFSLYTFLLEQSGKKYKTEDIQAIKQYLLKDHIEIFFMLLYFYRFCARSLEIYDISAAQLHGWLFYDELKGGPMQVLVQDFLDNSAKTTTQSSFTTTEKNLIHLLFPADILIRYLLESDNVGTTIRHLITNLFPQDKLKYYMNSFLGDGKLFAEFIYFVTDYTNFKTSYFTAMKKYITHVFQKQDSYDASQYQDLDEWMSTIGEGGSIDMARIPARLRQESETMERLMNFYITYIGGYWIGRGDSWSIRTLYTDLLNEILEEMHKTQKHDTIYYFSGILYSYSKNVFYYKYAFENIRAGKEKFHLPFRATFREVYSNACIIRLFESSFVAILLQDILPKDIKIYIKNPAIIQQFASLFKKDIALYIRKKPSAIISAGFSIYDAYFHTTKLTPLIEKHIDKNTIAHIKENFYSPDFWLYQKTLEALAQYVPLLQERYGDASIGGILASIRETIRGLYMYCAYVKQSAKTKKTPDHIDQLLKLYIVDVLNVRDECIEPFTQVFLDILEEYLPLIVSINGIDDNPGYLQIAWDNWYHYCFNKNTEEIFGGLSGEDIIRFRGFLKTISYYNKRYIIPN